MISLFQKATEFGLDRRDIAGAGLKGLSREKQQVFLMLLKSGNFKILDFQFDLTDILLLKATYKL
jgi:hypothetical protein